MTKLHDVTFTQIVKLGNRSPFCHMTPYHSKVFDNLGVASFSQPEVLTITRLPSTITALISKAERNVMEVKSADGVSIAYQVMGSSKPTLLFVHGWCCDQSHWDAQVHNLAPQYKVVTMDLAGHGKSGLDRKTWTMKAFSDDVVAVVEGLDLDQVILIGHSMGGDVIAWAELRMPERVIGLVGVDTFENVEEIYTRKQLDALLAPFQANFAEAMRGLVESMFMPNSDPILVERVAADLAAAPPKVGLDVARTFLRLRLSLAQVLKKVKAPIRCIASDRNTVNVEVARRYASSFEVVYMSNIGHFVMIEDPNTFNRLLDEIVKELISYQAEVI